MSLSAKIIIILILIIAVIAAAFFIGRSTVKQNSIPDNSKEKQIFEDSIKVLNERLNDSQKREASLTQLNLELNEAVNKINPGENIPHIDSVIALDSVSSISLYRLQLNSLGYATSKIINY